jgi:hypothetical protein
MASKDGWGKQSDDPITTPDGKQLLTLRDAIQYLAKIVPKPSRTMRRCWTLRITWRDLPSRANPMFFARAATLQAIHRNEERVFNPDRKDHHWGKRKLKRDQWCAHRCDESAAQERKAAISTVVRPQWSQTGGVSNDLWKQSLRHHGYAYQGRGNKTDHFKWPINVEPWNSERNRSEIFTNHRVTNVATTYKNSHNVGSRPA